MAIPRVCTNVPTTIAASGWDCKPKFWAILGRAEAESPGQHVPQLVPPIAPQGLRLVQDLEPEQVVLEVSAELRSGYVLSCPAKVGVPSECVRYFPDVTHLGRQDRLRANRSNPGQDHCFRCLDACALDTFQRLPLSFTYWLIECESHWTAMQHIVRSLVCRAMGRPHSAWCACAMTGR
jgi:hypothetical protein